MKFTEADLPFIHAYVKEGRRVMPVYFNVVDFWSMYCMGGEL